MWFGNLVVWFFSRLWHANDKTTFITFQKGIVFRIKKGATKGIQRLVIFFFIHPCVEVSKLH
jgi:hypothetical protein